MDSILEEKRNLHEERDRTELAIVNEMLSKKIGHRDKLDSEHRQKILLDRYMKCSRTLESLYSNSSKCESSVIDDDKANQRYDNSNHNNMTNAFNEFYIALREIKDFYSKHSDEQVVTLANEFEELEAARQIALGIKTNKQPQTDEETSQLRGSKSARLNSIMEEDFSTDDHDEINVDDQEGEFDREGEIKRLTRGLPSTDLVDVVEAPAVTATPTSRVEKLVEFTDEEGYGRYLDLTKCHEAYLQVIKREEVKPNYLAFLDKFDRFTDLNTEYKITAAYKNYVEILLEYFRDYSKRAKPLVDMQDMEKKVHDKFIEDWNAKLVPGWFHETDRLKLNETEQVELESYRSIDELMELGLDCLKKELQVRGLKCGGTLEERANRLWQVRGKPKNEIDDSLRAAPVTNKKGKKRSIIEPFTIAAIEAKLSMYAEYFNDHRLATIENVQRKQARTAEERNESDGDISDVEDEDNEQSDVIYNPKNLPLGWDGKPIPYWLYKLHGLNLTFTCEICGNATYKGPKTFQRHFAEWRHAHGMRCLGIPNTAHFANITKIQDAINLWDKLKIEKRRDKNQALNEEEYEDSQGNVVNKKTFEDLKRQGLL